MRLLVDDIFVKQLVASQFPQLRNLPVRVVESSGWDNCSFRLGDDFLVRMPSAEMYAASTQKEQSWLPKLAPHLPLDIPEPVVHGAPEAGYPFAWSIYKWIEGRSEEECPVSDLQRFAADLANFLKALWAIDTISGPKAGPDNFHRGGSLSVYDVQFRNAAQLLRKTYPADVIQKTWEAAMAVSWSKPEVWVHGDIAPSNLIVRNGRLRAVIDFGQLAVGDPACDLAIAWRRFDKSSRETFRMALDIDDATWERGRAWALWKALIVEAGLAKTNAGEASAAPQTVAAILDSH